MFEIFTKTGVLGMEDLRFGAANNGRLECLKYARENGCPWDENTCTAAALHGYLECLKYAHENGCPWDEWTCEGAAEHGHLECLKYAHENGMSLGVKKRNLWLPKILECLNSQMKTDVYEFIS